MSATPTKNGRGVLAQLSNGTSPRNSAKKHLPFKSTNVSTVAPTMNTEKPPTGRASIATVSDGNSRAPPNMRKRVSFAPDTIEPLRPSDRDPSVTRETGLSDEISDTLPPRPPPAKSSRLSRLTSPTPVHSPYFARGNVALGFGDDDDSVPLPIAPQLDDASMPELEPTRRSTRLSPVPLRRGSLAARDRASFGAFVDDEVTAGIEAGETREEYSLHDGFLERVETERDSDESDGDVTQNLPGFADLMESDSADAPDEGVRVAPLPAWKGERSRLSSASSRKSLSYVVKANDGEESRQEETRKKMRWSMAPIDDQNRADVDDSGEISDGDVTMQLGHGLLDLEEEDELEGDKSTAGVAGESTAEVSSKRHDAETSTISGIEKLQPRPVPPNCRVLFDEASTEDATLHYHDEVNVDVRQEATGLEQADQSGVQDQARSLLRKSETMKELSTVHSSSVTSSARNHITTPRSATGSRVRAMREVPSSSSQQEHHMRMRELSESVSRPSKRERLARNEEPALPVINEHEAESEALPSKEVLFDIDACLGMNNIHFDDKVYVDHREFSLASMESNTATANRDSLEWQVLEAVKKEKVLIRLQGEVEKQLRLIEDTSESILSLEREIQHELPPIFALLSDTESLSPKELGDYRVSLKRLRKVSVFQVRLDWVASRQKWEAAIRDDLSSAVDELNGDFSELRESVRALDELSTHVEEMIVSSGVDHRSIEFSDPALSEVKRKELKQEQAYIDELRELADSKRRSETQLVERKEALLPRKTALLDLLKSLQIFASAKTERSLCDLMAERAELNTIVQAVTGLVPQFISSHEIRLVISELMHVAIELNGDKVTSLSLKPMTVPGLGSSAIDSFVEGAVKLASPNLQHLIAVADIPFALHLCAQSLLLAKKTLVEAMNYFDENLGDVVSGGVQDGDKNALDISLLASFYSLELKVKFDLSMSISTIFPEPTKGAPHQELRGVEVTSYIGTAPSVDELVSTLRTFGFRRSTSMFSIPDALSAVWSMM